MPQPAAVDEMRTMSFDELRKRLESGFEQLLAMLPKGDEPALDCEYYSVAGQPTGRFVPGDPEHNLHLLRDFATIIRALRSTGGYPQTGYWKICATAAARTSPLLKRSTRCSNSSLTKVAIRPSGQDPYTAGSFFYPHARGENQLICFLRREMASGGGTRRRRCQTGRPGTAPRCGRRQCTSKLRRG